MINFESLEARQCNVTVRKELLQNYFQALRLSQ
jgi:hypothetical protein